MNENLHSRRLTTEEIEGDHPKVFEGNRWWQHRFPGWLSHNLNPQLNAALIKTGQGTANYYYAGFDHLKKTIAEDPLVKEYLTST